MDFATPTFHLVLQKQARDPEVVSSQLHQSHQVFQPVARIRRIARLSDLDSAEPVSVSERFGDEIPTWHFRGKR